MKLAIHKSNDGFHPRWVSYCQKKNISYKVVNCYDSDVISQLRGCDALLWHHIHSHPKDIIFAKQLLFSLEQAEFPVFPDFNTGWHFDDKLGQKYLFEALNAPSVPSFAFYSKSEAIDWTNRTTFPKVFKLRGGAGSANVSLVKTKNDAIKLIHKAFGKGFRQYQPWTNLKERWRKYVNGQADFYEVFKGILRFFKEPNFSKVIGYEKGYIYFQDFIANNDSDTRVIVIGNKAFAIKRFVRNNDFRASGSGTIEFNKDKIDLRTIKMSFELAKKMKNHCVGFDFVIDEKNDPLIVEIGYGFGTKPYDPCPGYWDDELKWHEGKFIPQEWMVDEVINTVRGTDSE